MRFSIIAVLSLLVLSAAALPTSSPNEVLPVASPARRALHLPTISTPAILNSPFSHGAHQRLKRYFKPSSLIPSNVRNMGNMAYNVGSRAYQGQRAFFKLMLLDAKEFLDRQRLKSQIKSDNRKVVKGEKSRMKALKKQQKKITKASNKAFRPGKTKAKYLQILEEARAQGFTGLPELASPSGPSGVLQPPAVAPKPQSHATPAPVKIMVKPRPAPSVMPASSKPQDRVAPGAGNVKAEHKPAPSAAASSPKPHQSIHSSPGNAMPKPKPASVGTAAPSNSQDRPMSSPGNSMTGPKTASPTAASSSPSSSPKTQEPSTSVTVNIMPNPKPVSPVMSASPVSALPKSQDRSPSDTPKPMPASKSGSPTAASNVAPSSKTQTPGTSVTVNVMPNSKPASAADNAANLAQPKALVSRQEIAEVDELNNLNNADPVAQSQQIPLMSTPSSHVAVGAESGEVRVKLSGDAHWLNRRVPQLFNSSVMRW